MKPQSTDAWQIGGVEVTALLGSQPNMARGESGTYDVKLSPDGRGDHIERYEQLMAYHSYAGEYYTYESAAGPVRYHERHIRDSLLTAVVPAVDDPTGRGVWGLIEDVSDDTESPESVCFVSVEVVYLADLDEYESSEAVQTALEADGVVL